VNTSQNVRGKGIQYIKIWAHGRAVATRLLYTNLLRAQTDRSIPGAASTYNQTQDV